MSTDTVNDVLEDTDLQDLQADNLLEGILQYCFVCFVEVHRWTGRIRIRNPKVEIEGKSIPSDLRTGGYWKLMPYEWSLRLARFEDSIRSTVRNTGTMFRRGVHVIPRSRFPEMVSRVRDLEESYREAATEIAHNLDSLHEKLQRPLEEGGLGPFYRELQRHIPSREEFIAKHYVDVGFLPVGGKTSDIVHLGVEDVEGYADELRRATDDMVRRVAENMIREPVQEFCEAVANLEEVASRGKARQGTIAMVRRAYEKLKGFSFMVPEEVSRRLDRLMESMDDVSLQDFNQGSQVANILTRQLRGIKEEIDSTETYVGGLKRLTRGVSCLR